MSSPSKRSRLAATVASNPVPTRNIKRRDDAFLSLRSVLWCLLIGLGISLRFVGRLWDEGRQLHPDERFLNMTVPKLQWPQSPSQYFDTSHATLNPFNHGVDFFIYGQLPLTLAKAVATVFDCDNYAGILIVGRALSALFDAASVLMLFFIGQRLAGRTVGFLSAALLAFTALHIQQAHFFVVDTFATFFLLGAFLFSLRWLDAWPSFSASSDAPMIESATQSEIFAPKRAIRNALMAGLFWGAAVACKIPCALFALIVFIFAIALWRRVTNNHKVLDQVTTDSETAPSVIASKKARAKKTSQSEKTSQSQPLIAIKVLWRQARHSILTTSLLLMATAFVSFRVLHPVAFEGNAHPLTLWGLLDIRLAADVRNAAGEMVGFWDSFRDTADIAAGRKELPWNLQWIGRPKVRFSASNLLQWAIGWPMIAAALGAIHLMIWRGISRESVPVGLIAAAIWSVLIFLYYSSTYMKYTRYHLMITPFVALCAAWFGVQWWRWASSRVPNSKQLSLHQMAALGFNGFVLNATALWAIACASIYTRPHTRLEATSWMRAHLAPQAALATESVWDDVVPLGGTGDLQMLDLRLYDIDDFNKRQNLLDTLSRAQYIIVSSNRVWGSVPRLPQRWPLTTAYYYALFEGRLGFRPIHQWESYPRLNLFGRMVEFPDDDAEESLTVYDHPRVVLFEKTPAFSRTEAEMILDPTLLRQRQDTPLIDLIESGWAPDEAALPKLPRLSTPN